ncbi:hypothetical protein SBA_ch1_22100 [Sphingomonas bisphenolicum]|uniref:Uncharacterized protein n=1 Tax=Sphingomonas bisphenolicum TaxID=296544 RepID=A0ABN5WID3_9SPHN|nr:hypothetical protein SBA_ch1_22100 [Sphingomonas bisphenolicum]
MRLAKRHVGANAVKGERHIGTITGADQPLGSQREHLPTGAQGDGAQIDLRKALQDIHAGPVDRTGGGRDADRIGDDRLDESPHIADMQVGIGQRAA